MGDSCIVYLNYDLRLDTSQLENRILSAFNNQKTVVLRGMGRETRQFITEDSLSFR